MTLNDDDHSPIGRFMRRYEYLLIYISIVVTITLVIAFLDG